MEHHPQKGFIPSKASDAFRWLYVTDIAEYLVLPTAVRSPLSNASSSTHNRIRRTAEGETVPLLSYHAELGGALLTEEVLRRVHTHMQWRLPEMASRQTLTVRQALGLSLIRHQLPEASEDDARCYMLRGWEKMHAPSFHREGINRTVLKDVALEGDHQDLLSHMAAVDVAVEALQTTQRSVQEGVRSWTWGPGRGSKQSSSKRTTKPTYPGGETEARMREWPNQLWHPSVVTSTSATGSVATNVMMARSLARALRGALEGRRLAWKSALLGCGAKPWPLMAQPRRGAQSQTKRKGLIT
eukprot:6474102-Amphidinium_carterae.1